MRPTGHEPEVVEFLGLEQTAGLGRGGDDSTPTSRARAGRYVFVAAAALVVAGIVISFVDDDGGGGTPRSEEAALAPGEVEPLRSAEPTEMVVPPTFSTGETRPPFPGDPIRPMTSDEFERGDGLEPGTVQAGAPLLSEPVELVVAIGSLASELVVVDLDSGAIHRLGREVEPWLAIGRWLVTRDHRNRWEVVPLDDPLSPPRRLPDGSSSNAAVPAEDGGVWLRRIRRTGRAHWQRIDLETGELLQQVFVPFGFEVPEGPTGRPLSGPEMVSSPDGGVLELRPDGTYELATGGELVAFSERLVLISSCGSGATCATRWVDRESYRTLDLVEPAMPLGEGLIFGDDELLVAEARTPDGPLMMLFDIPEGEAIATNAGRTLEMPWISPAGRFMARRGWDRLLIAEVQRGRSFSLSALEVEVGPDDHVVLGAAPPSS